MLAVALFYDGIIFGAEFMEAVPAVGTAAVLLVSLVVSVYAWLTFYIWFKFHGISFLGPKKMFTMPATFLIKLIPILGALPAWTAAVVLLFLTTRGEEALAGTLQRVGGAAGAVGKAAAVAGKVPGLSSNMKQGLNRASAGAEQLSAKAKEASEQLRSVPASRQQFADDNTRSRLQASAGATPPVIAPPPAAAQSKPAGDIGAQPVFRQTPSTEAPR